MQKNEMTCVDKIREVLDQCIAQAYAVHGPSEDEEKAAHQKTIDFIKSFRQFLNEKLPPKGSDSSATPETDSTFFAIWNEFYRLCPQPKRDSISLEGNIAEILANTVQRYGMHGRDPEMVQTLQIEGKGPILTIDPVSVKANHLPPEKLMKEPDKLSREAFALLSRGMYANVHTSWALRVERYIYCVKRGDLEEVEKMLRVFPKLAEKQGIIGALCGREMGNVEVTGFQVARMVGDFGYCPEQAGMVELILRYLSRAKAAEQLKEIENPEGLIFKQYGATLEVDDDNKSQAVYFGVDETLGVLDAFNEEYETETSGNFDWARIDKLESLWNVELGSAEKGWADWLKVVFSEEKKEGGEGTAWMEKDITRKVKREMSCLADWGRNKLGEVLGQNYAWVRGQDGYHAAALSASVIARLFSDGLVVIAHDRSVLAKYKAAQSLKSAELRSTLSREKPLDTSVEKVQKGPRH